MQAARQRSSATLDPLVVRQYAEAAATQAYRRAQPVEQVSCPDYRPAPLMLQRRRSQVTGRSEGSHFEDARLGRRRSTIRHDENKSTSSARPKPPHGYDLPSKESQTRTRRPASAEQSASIKAAHRKERIIPTSSDYQRKTPSAFTNGSPAARNLSATSGMNHLPQAPTPRYTEKSYDDGISVTYTEPQSYADRTRTEPDFRSRRASIRETQTDEEIIALARDRQLQESQDRKVRERKSFFGSFQKLAQRRTVTEYSLTGGITYDSSLPPFNYADDSLLAPLPPTHDIEPPTVYPGADTKSGRKTRVFSGSVKGQFKKLLRKASRAPSGLLSQYGEANHRTYAATDDEKPFRSQASPVPSDPFVTHDPLAVLGPHALFHNSDMGSNASIGGGSAADQSRVTSWTNSTAAGTSSTCAKSVSTSMADEHGRLQRSNSNSTLRKKGSFFGRPIQNRLRKSSQANLKGSEDSQNLFTALRERILPHENQKRAQDGGETAASQTSRISSALSTLPSQSRADFFAPSGHGRASPIRTVSPDPDAFKLPLMSPVVEASPEHILAADEADDTTPTAKHHASRRKTVPMLAAPPSPDRIARRVKQSQTRWQGALHSASSAVDGGVTSACDEDNPYELPSLSRNLPQDHRVDSGGLPQHTRIAAPASGAGERLLSPSVYSRATDGASPRPTTPEEGGMMVTITSREVKRFEISPPKKHDSVTQRPVQASNEWRKWLSEEMLNLTEQDPVSSLTLPQYPNRKTGMSTMGGPSRPRTATNGSGSQRQSSSTPTSDQPSKGPRECRPRASSRRSSYMNERYPMVESSEGSSRRTSRKFSTTSNNATDTQQSLKMPSSDDSKRSVEGNRSWSRTEPPKPLPKRHSLAHLESSSQVKASSASISNEHLKVSTHTTSSTSLDDHSTSVNTVRPSAHHKHKSAFDLRAQYKPSSTSTSRPVEVRRKNTAPMAIFEDATLQNISAGPYAANTSASNKENTPTHATDDGNLPAVSSSEWLAGPKRGTASAIATRPKSSLPNAMSLSGNSREGSPGQRLVTGWLEGRRVKPGRDGEVALV